jgi:mannose-1-phosphate guanylyltransferase/mannose-6-phosphate isomerase
MSQPRVAPIILSGGSGSRLWPMSREQYPKQLLPLINDTTMLQDTLLRLDGLDGALLPQIVCNQEHRFLVAEQVKQINRKTDAIILEPMGRNTAPAIAISALQQADPDTVLLVLASDHVIEDVAKFHQHVAEGAQLAALGYLVTFGIVPDQPLIGYGYIESGAAVEAGFAVTRFVEKPDLATAEQYLKAGNFYWNSGMFMFTAGAYLQALAAHQPDMLEACQQTLASATQDLDFIRLDAAAFEQCPNISIDYAVMEHVANGVVIPMAVGWNDLGSWSSLWDVSTKDEQGNKFVGDVMSTNANNNYVNSGSRLVALIGVDDLVVVDTPDALLVANRSQVQEVKTIYNRIKQENRSETLSHRQVYRPWGSYDSIDADDGFQVKRIVVNPGASLSLQKHYHRAEHWIVVSGTAEVTCGEKVYMVNKNESTYIPIGEKHRLTNPGKIPLQLIEIQSGDYLGEDDIVRFDDIYGRKS